MKESKFAVKFRHWLRANPRFSCAFELKQTTQGSIPFSALEDHQADYLLAIKSEKGTLIRVQGVNGEPDYIYLRKFPANVVIQFPAEFHLIDIETFLLEKSRSKRKSLTNARAREISLTSVKTKN